MESIGDSVIVLTGEGQVMHAQGLDGDGLGSNQGSMKQSSLWIASWVNAVLGKKWLMGSKGILWI